MNDVRLTRNLAAGAIIILLLLVVATLIFLVQSRNYANETQAKLGDVEFTYDRDIFNRVIDPEKKFSDLVSCTAGICFENVKRIDTVVDAKLVIREKLDLRSVTECLDLVDNTGSDQTGVSLPQVLANTELLSGSDGDDLEYRVRFFADRRCYEANGTFVPYNEAGETAARYYNRRNLIAEQSLDVVASADVPGYSAGVLISAIRDFQNEISVLGQTDSSDDTTNTDQVNPQGKRAGEVVYESENYIVSFQGVTTDTRCPSEVNCVNPGEVRVMMDVMNRSAGEGVVNELSLGEMIRLQADGIHLVVVDVNPNRSINSEIDPSEYRVTVIESLIEKQSDEITECVRAGCSNQLCVPADQAGEIVTTCEYRGSYACYDLTTCEVQPGGECGFTETPEFSSCLENPPALE